MAVIGVYDSGIGGLTSVKIILERFIGNEIYYLADNLNHPFGTKNEDTLKEIISNGIKKVKTHSDITVIACNTASSLTEDSDVVKLLPPLEEYKYDASNTLFMATTRTIANTNADSAYNIANTPELATLVEVQAGLNYIKNNLNMDELMPYFLSKIGNYKGVKRVILGCSHYLYCKTIISKCLGEVEFADGNESLCRELSKFVQPKENTPSKITFDFTSQNEAKKYNNILRLLINGKY